ncbi:MAG TPA: CHAT domain-containing protein [Pyrinomonadaceae bacterium]
MASQSREQNLIKRYLLKQLSVAEQEEIELRLLSDDGFAAELEIAEDELIDEYVNHELSPPDKLRFEEVFLTTPERTAKLKSAEALKRYLDKLPSPRVEKTRSWTDSLRSLFSLPLRIPASVTAVIVFLVLVIGAGLIWRVAFYQSDLKKGLVALNDAYRQQRPIQARVTELDYAPYVTTRGNEAPRVNRSELDRATILLSDADKDKANADSAHALGKLYLLQKDYEKAIEYLTRAIKGEPGNAQFSADLGAAYLEKGRHEQEEDKNNASAHAKGSEDLGRSIEYLKQALALNPNLLEALFNLGLVHQQQKLYQEAEADWRTYIEKDPNSQWTIEARQNLQSLQENKNRSSSDSNKQLDNLLVAYHDGNDSAAWEVYRRSYGSSDKTLVGTLIQRLVNSNSPEDAAQVRKVLDYIGQLEKQNNQDSFTQDLARVYGSATPQTLQRLAEARKKVTEGSASFRRSRFSAAIELFEGAQAIFAELGDKPEWLSTAAALGHVFTTQPDNERAQKVFDEIEPTCKAQHYEWLRGGILIDIAHLQSNLNKPSDAINESKKALELFERLNDPSNILEALIQQATLHVLLNDTATSLTLLDRALQLAQAEKMPAIKSWGIFTDFSLNMTTLNLYRAALDYQKEALQIALASNAPPRSISRSYQNLGSTYGALRQFDLAFENLRKAYEQGELAASDPDGQNMMASSLLKTADLYRLSGDQTSAIAAYDESSKKYQELGYDHYSYAAHKGKFLSYLAQNNDELADQEMQRVLRLFEQSRQRIQGERLNNFYFDREQDIYDLAIDFTYSRLNNGDQAFDYSERCRARNARKLMTGGEPAKADFEGSTTPASYTPERENPLPLTKVQIEQQLPEEVELVQYAVLEKKVLIWCLTRSDSNSAALAQSSFTHVVDIDSLDLHELVKTALRQIGEQDQTGANESLKRLYQLLIKPLEGQLDHHKVLCFIPDKDLHFLPFAALVSPDTGHYLVEDYRLMTSPSASILIDQSIKAANQSRGSAERILAIGNPTFNRTSNPTLSDLASAEREVNVIAKDYDESSRVLIGPQATLQSVKENLKDAQVVHFAAHYVVDNNSPLSSKILLAGKSEESTDLSSGDISSMKLTRTKLVVLSACQTGIEQNFRGEGPIGFARSFMVAGVPVIVGSLWAVDSEATSDLMIQFHHKRRLDHSSTAALAGAQRNMIKNEKYRNPYYWAGFAVIGGYSDF